MVIIEEEEILKSIGSLALFLVFTGIILAVGINIFDSLKSYIPSDYGVISNESFSLSNMTLDYVGNGIVPSSDTVIEYDTIRVYVRDVDYYINYTNGNITFNEVWRNITPSSSPPGRWTGLFVCNNAQMCVLSMGKGCLINGLNNGSECQKNGEISLNDTWIYFSNNNTWLNITSTAGWVASTARRWIYGTYISTNNSAMFYSGSPSSGSYSNDSYYFHFDTLTWENVTNSTAENQDFPIGAGGTGLAGYMMAYDSSRDEVVLYGGSNLGATLENSTWIFFAQNRTWRNMYTNMTKTYGSCVKLVQENYGGMSYDAVNDVMIVPHLLSPCGSNFMIYNISNNSWEAKPDGKGYIEQAGVGYFPPTNSTLIAGGDKLAISRNWSYSILANFSLTAPINGSVHSSHGGMLSFDSVNKVSYFFSGCEVNSSTGACRNVTDSLYKYYQPTNAWVYYQYYTGGISVMTNSQNALSILSSWLPLTTFIAVSGIIISFVYLYFKKPE